MFGILASAGWTIEEALDHTFPQLYVAAEVIVRARIEALEMVVTPIADAFGHPVSPAGVQTNPSKPPTPARPAKSRKKMTAQEKDAHRLMLMHQSPFGLKVEGGGGPAGAPPPVNGE